MKCCTKLETAKERCPIVFQGHPSNFKVTRYKTSPILTQIGCFRTTGRSQLSNLSDLPCSNMSLTSIMKSHSNWGTHPLRKFPFQMRQRGLHSNSSSLDFSESIYDIACFIGIQAIEVRVISINEAFDFKRSYFNANENICWHLCIPAHLFVCICNRLHVHVTHVSSLNRGVPIKPKIYFSKRFAEYRYRRGWSLTAWGWLSGFFF